jgi:hypothetical protein
MSSLLSFQQSYAAILSQSSKMVTLDIPPTYKNNPNNSTRIASRDGGYIKLPEREEGRIPLEEDSIHHDEDTIAGGDIYPNTHDTYDAITLGLKSIQGIYTGVLNKACESTSLCE